MRKISDGSRLLVYSSAIGWLQRVEDKILYVNPGHSCLGRIREIVGKKETPFSADLIKSFYVTEEELELIDQILASSE